MVSVRNEGGNLEMRVFIMAIDGLDYDLVLKWKLKHLLQKTFGKLYVGREFSIKPSWVRTDFSMPYTPIVWASFLTGKSPREHKVKSLWCYNNRIIEIIRHFPLLSKIKRKRVLLKKMGIKLRVGSPLKVLNLKTFLDFIKPSIAVDIVTYNEPEQYRLMLQEAGNKPIKEILNIIRENHNQRVKKILKLVKQDWKLFMAYFDLIDYVGHIYINKNLNKLHSYYRMINELAYVLQLNVKSNTVFLIVSDHGMQPCKHDIFGYHTNYAFWSLNIRTDWKPRNVTDFYGKILEWTKR
jgi:hypothetical protein